MPGKLFKTFCCEECFQKAVDEEIKSRVAAKCDSCQNDFKFGEKVYCEKCFLEKRSDPHHPAM